MMREGLLQRRLTYAGALILGAFLGFGTVALSQPLISTTAGREPLSESRGSGTELALIYIGSSTCAAAKDPDLTVLVDSLAEVLRGVASERGFRFTTIGIAKDWETSDGLEHLGRFDEFDELIVGRGWLNAGGQRYVWRDIPGIAAVPQVLVVTRQIRYADSIHGYDVNDEQLVARKAGLQEIESWLRLGVSLELPR